MKIAFQKASITPSEPSYLCGHAMRTATHTGVLDELYISVLRLRDETNDYLFASVDLVGLDEELVALMSERATRYGILKENVIISVIHTHAAPEFTEVNMFTEDPNTGCRLGYREFLVDQFEAALKTCDDFHEVEASYATVMIDGYFSNRNNKEFPCDKQAHIIRFTSNDEPIAMIVNLSCHPTVLGPQNTLLSADLFGSLRAELKKMYHCDVFMMNGAQGDVSNRQYRQGNDEKELKRVTIGIVTQLNDLVFQPISICPIHIKDITYVIDYMSDPSAIDQEIIKAKEILATETNEDILKVTRSGIAFMKKNKLEDPHVHVEIKTRIITMGELTIVTVGGELFTKFSLAIKQAFPKHKLFIWGITDASVGYLVEEGEYGKNYESMTTRIPKGEVEKYCEHIIQELQTNIA